MPPRPVIDVNIPFYGPAKLLSRCLKSIEKQHPGDVDLKVHVFDDHSPESANALAGRFPWVEIVRWSKNIGMVANWNRCLEIGEAEFVHVLHYDDLVLPRFYEEVASAARSNPSAGLFYSRFNAYRAPTSPVHFLRGWRNRIRPNPVPTEKAKWNPPGDQAVRSVLKGVVCSSAVLARSAVGDVGGFDTRFAFSADEEYWPRLASRWGVVCIEKPLVAYRYHRNNYQYRTWSQPDFWEQYVLLKKTRLQYLSKIEDADYSVIRKNLGHLATRIALSVLARGDSEAAELYLFRAREQFPEVVTVKAYRRARKLLSWGMTGRLIARAWYG